MADIIHYKASCDIFINYKCSVSQKQNMGIFLGKLRTGVHTESGPESRRIALHLSRKRGDAVSAAWFCRFCLPEMIMKLFIFKEQVRSVPYPGIYSHDTDWERSLQMTMSER